MDEDFNLWLIEVNTNPCLEESSNMLKYYIRRMVEDMIKVEIDPKFPRPKRKRQNEKINRKEHETSNNIYKVQTEQKRRQSEIYMSKNDAKRKLSYSQAPSSNHRKRQILKKRAFSKSSISKRIT